MNGMCRDASCWMGSEPCSIPNWRPAARDRTSRCNYEITITLLARASRKHMRVVAALTERMRTRHGSRAGWPLIHPKPKWRDNCSDLTTRKKEEVPKWFVLAANLSLKLHLENSFYAFERVVRCGGLLSALPPQIASKHLAPQTQQILLECRGFNDKNQYQRTTPCDQDFLRKFVRDVSAADWQAWFNGALHI